VKSSLSEFSRKTQSIFISGLVALSALVIWGSFRAYSRGGNDFSVFYEAWRLVLAGRGQEIYQVSPDRFLYSPGFAWLLAPLGMIPREISLAIWCFGKFWVLAYLAKRFSSYAGVQWGVMIWAILFVSRPLLIDLEYGQINLYLLGVCAWGLLGHFENRFESQVRTSTETAWDFIRWFFLSFFAVSKLFPMPLLLVPWLVTRGAQYRKLKAERIASFCGGAVSIFFPLLTLRWEKVMNLCDQWYRALLARGLPLESHNQSFTALLNHYLSGNPTHVISEGTKPIFLGGNWLSPEQISFLSLAWTGITLGITLGWILSGNSRSHFPSSRFQCIAILAGFLIIPSHLIWKPYFVFSLPMIFWLVFSSLESGRGGLRVFLALVFLGINFTGFDFVGHQMGTHLEAASMLLLMHVFLLGMSWGVRPFFSGNGNVEAAPLGGKP
jgi:hypothetical protein